MNKDILIQYIDACELIKETKDDIKRLKKNRKQIAQDSVKGSMSEFPYAAKSFHIEGLAYSVVKEPERLDHLEQILLDRIARSEEVKHQVEIWLNTIPQRMQRIIRYRIFEELSWNEVAERMGRKSNGESVRKEFENFMKRE